jgi:hypothetical protein
MTTDIDPVSGVLSCLPFGSPATGTGKLKLFGLQSNDQSHFKG